MTLTLTVSKSFLIIPDKVYQRILAEMASQGPMLRSAQVLKQEAKDLGLEENEIAEYVKPHQALGREGQLGEVHRRYVQIVQDETQKTQIAADLDKARIKADKELTLREMELKAYA